MSKPLLGDIVACVWRDAHASVKDEFTPEEVLAATSYKFTTYGVLIRDDRGSDGQKTTSTDPLVAVAAEVGEDGRYRGVTYIPAEMVISVAEVVKKRKKREHRPSPDPEVQI